MPAVAVKDHIASRSSRSRFVQRLTHHCGCAASRELPAQNAAGELIHENWRAMAKRGVPALRIVPAFDVAKEDEPRLGVRGESVLCQAFAFEC